MDCKGVSLVSGIMIFILWISQCYIHDSTWNYFTGVAGGLSALSKIPACNIQVRIF